MPVGNHTLPSELVRTCSDGMMSCLAQWAYTVTNGWFWALMLGGFVVSLFFATAALGSKRAFGYAGFIGLIGAVWLGVMGLMSWWIASVFMLVGAIFIALMIMSER